MSAVPSTHDHDEETKQPPPASSHPAKTLGSLTFDNKVLRSVPVGRDGQRGTLFSLVDPTPLSNPHIVSLSPAALGLLDLSVETLSADPNTPLYLSGNLAMPGSQSASHCYCGHQFGAFAGQLGDGAVCYVGEVLNAAGARWELQFKGSGLTPYSRSADGRKVLRSSMREYLASEAMAALGIPTTRAASLVTSDTRVLRDPFYTGDARLERASIITRLAPTFIRFGSFEVCKTRDPRTGASGPCVGRTDVLRRLMDYTVESFYPEVAAQYAQRSVAERDVAVYGEVVRRTARLIAQWQCVGFIHGVMNTDNMSAVGLTIDYGPYRFMDAFIPSSTSNTSDEQFRYAYDRQRSIGRWNLGKLAEAFSLLWKDGEREATLADMARVLDAEYERAFEDEYYTRMARKLGLKADAQSADVRQWVARFLDVLEATCGDFTNSFRALSTLSLHADNSAVVVDYLTQHSSALATYLDSLQPRIDPDQLAYFQHVLASSPNVRDSSGLIEGERQRTARRKEVAQLTDDSKRERDRALWTAFIRDYRAYVVKEWTAEEEGARRRAMNSVNPKYVLRSDHSTHRRPLPAHSSPVMMLTPLCFASCAVGCPRNWMAQVAIERAEKDGDYSECNALLATLSDPFCVHEDEVVVSEGDDKAKEIEASKAAGAGRYTCRPPNGYENVLCSCSS